MGSGVTAVTICHWARRIDTLPHEATVLPRATLRVRQSASLNKMCIETPVLVTSRPYGVRAQDNNPTPKKPNGYFNTKKAD